MLRGWLLQDPVIHVTLLFPPTHNLSLFTLHQEHACIVDLEFIRSIAIRSQVRAPSLTFPSLKPQLDQESYHWHHQRVYHHYRKIEGEVVCANRNILYYLLVDACISK